MTNIKSLFAGLLVASSLAYAGAAQAGEVGVSNRYSSGSSNSRTYVDIYSEEVHAGTEANWAYASKDYTAKTFAPDTSYTTYYGYTYPVPGRELTSEIVSADSGATSSGTYYTLDTAKGFNDTYSNSNFTDHTTTAFSNP